MPHENLEIDLPFDDKTDTFPYSPSNESLLFLELIGRSILKQNGRTLSSPPVILREALFADREGHSAASSSCSPSMRICSSSRSSASMAAVTSCWTWAAASSSSGESWTLR